MRRLRLPYRWSDMRMRHEARCPCCHRLAAWITEEAVVRYQVEVPRWMVHLCKD